MNRSLTALIHPRVITRADLLAAGTFLDLTYRETNGERPLEPRVFRVRGPSSGAIVIRTDDNEGLSIPMVLCDQDLVVMGARGLVVAGADFDYVLVGY